MKKNITKSKRGIASFYMVAFSTLILVVIAASFATVIVSEIARTSNDDLSQSAYDAALAGVEDAKLAYANYRKCVEANKTASTTKPTGTGSVTCPEIIYWMQNPDCDMVGHILGRIGKDETKEVSVSDKKSKNSSVTSENMNQAYTCVKISTTSKDYRANLSDDNQVRIVKAQFDTEDAAREVTHAKISWYSNNKETVSHYNYENFSFNANRVTFKPIDTMKTILPPTIAVQLIQTSKVFKLQDFEQSSNDGRTDRATVYLVPTDKESAAASSNNSYTGTYKQNYNNNNNSNVNIITAEQIASTNDHKTANKPFVAYCNQNDEFACSVTLVLPKPINGERTNNTFLFAVSLPYGEPDTDFSIEFCTEENACLVANETVGTDNTTSIATQKDVQVVIDSTGRAADLYRRVESRLETTDTSFSYPFYTIQVLGKNGTGNLNLSKNLTVTKP